MEFNHISVYDTVSYDEVTDTLVIIDQTKLPGETVFLNLCCEKDIFEAINNNAFLSFVYNNNLITWIVTKVL